MMQNLSFMVAVSSSECAVKSDYDREMATVQRTCGIASVDAALKGAVNGAIFSARSDDFSGREMLEIDAASLGSSLPASIACCICAHHLSIFSDGISRLS